MIYGQDKHKKSPSSISLGFYQCRKKGIIRDCKCESNWMQLSNSILHFLFNPREGKNKIREMGKIGGRRSESCHGRHCSTKVGLAFGNNKKKYESDAHSRFLMLLQCCTYETLQPVK